MSESKALCKSLNNRRGLVARVVENGGGQSSEVAPSHALKKDLPLDRFGDLDSGVNLAGTESRSVLGYMNEWGGSASTRLPTPVAWVEPMPGS